PAGASSHRGELWFNVDPAEGASELWRTDGTLNGTALFSTTLVAREPLVAGTLLGDGGEDVRLSDGTFSGTRPLETAVGKELPLTEWTHVATAHGIAYYVQTNPFRLWRVDGTAAGTRIIFQAAGGSTYANRSATVGNVVFFIAGSGMLIRTDGTEAGTALVHTFASIPDAMWSAGPRVFFRFNAAQELWTSDGTVTKLLRANWPAPAAMNNCAATVIPAGAGFGGFSFWLQTPDVVSSELWRSDGTTDGTIRLRAFRSRSSSFLGWLCEGLSLVSANGRLYFPGFDDDADGELWTSDGTAGGTRELFDLTDALGGSRPQSLTVAGTQLYFTAETPEIGRELYVLPNVNRLPLLAPLASRRVTPNTLVSFLLGGTDADGDSVTYSALSLPFGATLNGTTGAFAWTPSSAQTGSYTLTFVAADNAGGTATQSTTITVGTMAVFTDDPLLPGTRIKAVHFSELVIAINEYRAMASLAPIALSDFGAGAVIRATHLTTLRNGINQARAAMGLSAATFTGGTIVRAIHIQELRDLVR
ncbi:MAG TPA: putative Ig domain-containing protein, partial [Thermoanaerobaculia bacterium]